MRNLSRLILALAAFLMLAACSSNVRTYVDPQYHRADWSSIKQPAQATPVHVIAHFQQNGKPAKDVDVGLKTDVENTLRRSNVFAPTTRDAAEGTITVVANNQFNADDAKHKGTNYVTSFGSATPTISDNYTFDISYQTGTGKAFEHQYNHRLISTMGHGPAPEGLTPTTLADGFQQVVRDVVLNFIQDWQNAHPQAARGNTATQH